MPTPMTSTEPALALGQPTFVDADLAECAKTQGMAAAWRLAFSRSGIDALRRVHGPFAVAMPMDDGRMVLAVDRFGVHSLCYRVSGERLLFAPRADELAESAEALDPQSLFDYLYFHVIPSPRTVWQGVHRLPPGHCAVLERGRLTVSPYWTPAFSPEERPDFGSLRDEFRTVLKTAVTRQLDGSKPACFLSGGTDSSTVAGMLGEVAGRPAATYSIGFEAEGYDEMAFARIAAKRFGTEHHEYYVTPNDLVSSIPTVAGHYDQPFGNSSALPAFYCARMAQQDGVRRILAGDGGDELFGGNSRYAKQRVFGWYDSIPAIVRGAMEPVLALPAVAGLPLLGKGSSYVKQAKVPMPDRLQTYNLLQRLGVGNVLTPEFLRTVDAHAPQAQQRAVWLQASANTSLDRQLAFDWRYTLAENDLPKVCGTTALAGVTAAFPMLDQDLVDFSLRLPTEYKLKGLKLRWFFKEALRGFLPDEIITKKKQGFGLPFGVWAHRHAALKALASDSLSSLSARGIVRPEFIQPLLNERLAEHPGYYGEMIWILMMLEQWLQKHSPRYRAA